MAWSKVQTTTNGFSFHTIGTDPSPELNYKSADGTAVLEEYVAFLETRGWIAEISLDSETSGRAWTLRKDFVCTDGGTQTIGFYLRYDISTNPDRMYMYSWNVASGYLATSAKMFDFSLTDYQNSGPVCAGKWSFWTSDEDNDSFLIMAEETPGDCIIGFWPASGTIHRQGYGNSTYAYMTSGFKPLFPGYNQYPSWESNANSISSQIGHLFVDPSYRTGLPSETKKFDYVWLCNGYGRPLMRQFGGDVHCMVSLGTDTTSYFIQNGGFMQPTAVYEIGGRYWIGVEYGGPVLLFDCGETAPVF